MSDDSVIHNVLCVTRTFVQTGIIAKPRNLTTKTFYEKTYFSLLVNIYVITSF